MKPTPVSAAEAKQMVDRGDRIAFVDARTPVAWEEAESKLPGAIRIPVDEVGEHIRGLPHDGTVITYCT